MPEETIANIGQQRPKPRIVQHRNRRYSIRLEPVFWLTLENLARQKSMRLGQFVAALANEYAGGNFSSYLRVVCMLETERALAEASLKPSQGNVLDVVMACPSPGVVLSRFRTIVGHNASFAEWLGPGHKPLTGADLTEIIQVRTRRPLNDIWLDLIAGTESRAEARVLYVEPGRAIAATARILALQPTGSGEFFAVMWLASAKRPAPEGQRSQGAEKGGQAAA
jgi:predicted DNA-binding ribbon-helix-helix protein